MAEMNSSLFFFAEPYAWPMRNPPVLFPSKAGQSEGSRGILGSNSVAKGNSNVVAEGLGSLRRETKIH
eukprot:14709070-Heterocapsa_arctica.AAC.1